MNLTQYLDIVSALNHGNVIFGDNENKNEIQIGVDNLRLYLSNNKYYFISEFKGNLVEIENQIINNEVIKTLSNRKPNNSYLILLYNVESISNDIYKEVIKIEENEFFYKKYVFYYTDSEFIDFMEWWNKIELKELNKVLSDENLDPNTSDNHSHFLLRLLIKTPFINLEFPRRKMEDFEQLLDNKLNRLLADKSEVDEIYRYLSESLEKSNPEEIIDNILREVIKEGEDESKIDKF